MLRRRQNWELCIITGLWLQRKVPEFLERMEVAHKMAVIAGIAMPEERFDIGKEE